MRVNFTGAEDRGNFDAFRGKHHVKITDITDTETKNAGKLPAGTEGWSVEFTVQEGQYENRKIWNNYWFAPSTLGFLRSMLVATGEYSKEDLQGDFDVELDDLIGLDLVVSTRIQKGDGNYEDRTVIKGYYPYDEDEDYSGETVDAGSSFLPS